MRRTRHMARMKVIVNPAAGAGKTAKKWPQIMVLMKSLGLDFEHDVTEAPGHAMELAKSAVGKGYESVVSVGGDGTIHEIVNGLHEAGGGSNVAVGIVNTGTGADYIRTIGVPRRYKEACQCLLSPNRRTVDLGVVEYTKDGEHGERRVCTILLNNGRYGGGGMLPAPNADPGDGFFDLVIIDDITKPDLIMSLPRIYRGTHLTHPKVTLMRAREVEITPTLTSAVQADGELLGEAPAPFSVLPGALTVII